MSESQNNFSTQSSESFSQSVPQNWRPQSSSSMSPQNPSDLDSKKSFLKKTEEDFLTFLINEKLYPNDLKDWSIYFHKQIVQNELSILKDTSIKNIINILSKNPHHFHDKFVQFSSYSQQENRSQLKYW